MPRRSDKQTKRQAALILALKRKGFSASAIDDVLAAIRESRTDADRAAVAARVRKHRQGKPPKSPLLIPRIAARLSTDPNAPSLMVGPATAKAIVNRAVVEAGDTTVKPRRLADDWTMDASAVDYGKNLGLSEKDVMREAVKFRNYWTSKGSNAAKVNWKRTFENWLITASEHKGATSNGKFNERNSIGAAAERLADRGDFAIKPRPVLSSAGKVPDGSVSE